MKEIHDWVPWFRELAGKIAEGGEAYLIEKAKQVRWGGEKPALLRFGDENIDPFSFFYFLASKNTRKQREKVYGSVHKVFEIEIPLPDTGIKGTYIFPSPPPLVPVLFHNGTVFDPVLLWGLFRQAVRDDPNVVPDDFKKALKITKVGVAKLTQTLFLINPGYFLPIDNSTEVLRKAILDLPLSDIKKKMENGGYEEYQSVRKKLKEAFPGCQPYEINMFLYLQKSGKIKVSDNFFQISTMAHGPDGDDYWDDFKENNYVYTGGPGSGKLWGEKGKYPLTQPERGDIILVRTGVKKGRAIGIVYQNDYAETDGLNENGRIHVLWINKSEEEFSGQTERSGFNKAELDSETYLVFEKTKGFAPTFDLIKHLKGLSENNPEPDPDESKPKIVPMKHPLNQILYGPPGTGKTWNTVNYALAIIEDKFLDELQREDHKEVKRRFDELKRNGRIAMVTFHQNFTYEDFIEGIRPVLADDENENIKYELSKGVFRRISDRASTDTHSKYVLIIDEINRGNIAKIFGELITLIERSKRLGRDDEAKVTLPYSQESFGVPKNLYIIGTMNTADRSIALLDTALRRRFEFIEMMPKPYHDLISTNINGVNCRELLAAMNERIHFLLDREHQIGHTYFFDVNDMESLSEAFKTKIIPLLQEYFYDNWEKIDLVLNRNRFIRVPPFRRDLFKESDLIDEQRKIYELSDDRWENPESYRAIYEREQGETDETTQDT